VGTTVLLLLTSSDSDMLPESETESVSLALTSRERDTLRLSLDETSLVGDKEEDRENEKDVLRVTLTSLDMEFDNVRERLTDVLSDELDVISSDELIDPLIEVDKVTLEDGDVDTLNE